MCCVFTIFIYLFDSYCLLWKQQTWQVRFSRTLLHSTGEDKIACLSKKKIPLISEGEGEFLRTRYAPLFLIRFHSSVLDPVSWSLLSCLGISSLVRVATALLDQALTKCYSVVFVVRLPSLSTLRLSRSPAAKEKSQSRAQSVCWTTQTLHPTTPQTRWRWDASTSKLKVQEAHTNALIVKFNNIYRDSSTDILYSQHLWPHFSEKQTLIFTHNIKDVKKEVQSSSFRCDSL